MKAVKFGIHVAMTVTLVILISFISITGFSGSAPPLPSDYQGYVYITVDGEREPAPSGTIVYAIVSNGTVEYRSNNVTTTGGYYDNLVVAPPDSSYLDKTLYFYVKPPGKPAKIGNTTTFKGGLLNEIVNLTYVTENHPPSQPSKPLGPTSGYVNQSYSYSTSSTDPDGDQIKYGWDWDGDGNVDEWTGFYNSGETITLSHSWSQPGTYQIKVKAMDREGDESEWSESLTVTILTSTKKPPVAVISAPDVALVNQTISLDASHSSDPDGTIVNYTWNFGDGNIGYGVAVTHSYSLPGNYTITLIVTDNDNLVNSTTHTIWIQRDSDNDGWSDQEEQTYGTDPYNASSHPEDTDGDRIPDPVDPDDDNDGLNDTMEQEIGSPQDKANEYVEPIIDGKITYIVDTDNDGIYDTFYDPGTNIKTNVEQNEEGKYLIDSDGDGVVEYVYDPASGAINPYGKPTKPIEIPWSMVVLIIVVVLLIIVGIVYLYKKRKI